MISDSITNASAIASSNARDFSKKKKKVRFAHLFSQKSIRFRFVVLIL